jgi:hypothetical protein
MHEIVKTLSCPYKRYLFTKKVIYKTLQKDLFEIYELNSYKKLKYNKKIRNIIDINSLFIEKYNLKVVKYLQEQYLSHRFDILGSGWVYVSKNSENTNRAKQLRSLFEYSNDYEPIDWNIDIKTHYKFSYETIHKAGHVECLPKQVDVKNCWELARMHHLVLLSIFSLIMKNKANILEFKNQIIDFSYHNPIGYGINWCGSMDPSIRATNLLVAYDIFKQIDDESILDDDFEHFFASVIYQHGRFITNNLEVDLLNGKNHNHYLSNIVGLLYISAYLNNNATKKWWSFAKKEFFSEIDKQFFEDGCNFEGSTSYHRLSGEMFVYGMAIIKRIDGNLPEGTIEKLRKAAYFSKTIKKRSNKIVQIGDNDSGRFLKFTVQGEFISSEEAVKKYLNLNSYLRQNYEATYFDEDFLNHDTFIASVAGLINSPEFSNEKNKYPLEFSIIKSIANSYPISDKTSTYENIFIYNQNQLDYNIFSNTIKNTIILDEPYALTKNGKWTIFQNFGLCCYKSDILELFIYAGRKNRTGINSHIHNDKLHFEFCINRNEFFSDPGTGVYTSDIICREMFRDYKSHNVPDYGINLEQAKSVFCMEEKTNCEIITLNENSISLYLYTDTIKHLRRVTINEKSIIVEDYGNQKFDVNLKEAEYFSNGYGKLLNKNNFELKIKKESNK